VRERQDVLGEQRLLVGQLQDEQDLHVTAAP
jgi:hypothetical protein